MAFRSVSTFNDRQSVYTSPRSTKESLFTTTLWSLAILIIALPQGFATRIGSIGLRNSATSAEIRKAWGTGDAGSLLDAAKTWAHGHQLDATTQFWIVHLWSPGMSILEIPLIWLEKLGIPLFWSLLFVTILLWSTIFYVAWKYGSVLIGRVALSIAAVLLLFSWDFRYIFRDDLFYTEGIGYGLLLLGILVSSWMILVSKYENSKRLTFIAGICIGASIWVRHVSDTGLLLFVGLSSLLFLWNWKFSKGARAAVHAASLKKKNPRTKRTYATGPANHWRSMGALPYLTLTAWIGFLVTLPWRIISPLFFQGWPWVMSSASAGVSYSIWATNSSDTGKYWGSYGMNWGCNIDPKTCAIVNLKIHSPGNSSLLMMDAIKAAILHPLAYIQNRSSYAIKNWIPGGIHAPIDVPMTISLLSGLTFLVAIYFYIRIQSKKKHLLAVVWLSFLGTQLGQLAIIHYESRYFIPVRILFIGFFLALLALIPSRVKRSDQNFPPSIVV